MNNFFRRIAPLAVRAASFLGGAGMIYHETVVADTAEPLLVFVGLWLAGAPIADFLDKLRRLAQLPGDPPDPPAPADPTDDVKDKLP